MEEASKHAMAGAQQHMQSLWTSSKFSDCIVKCKGSEWKAHKSVICACQFFDKALNSGFMEQATNTFNLDDDDPDAVRHMLKHLYGFSKFSKDLATRELLRVCAIADKYLLPNLRQEASRVLRVRISDWKACLSPDQIAGCVLASLVSIYEYTDLDGQPFAADVLHFFEVRRADVFAAEFKQDVAEALKRCPELLYEVTQRTVSAELLLRRELSRCLNEFEERLSRRLNAQTDEPL